MIQDQLHASLQRPRPFGVNFRFGWGGFALPSFPVTAASLIAVAVLYTLVPKGRWRNRGKGMAAVLVGLIALARVRLGVDAPTDVLVGAALGVVVPLLAFRLATPNAVFPVTYRRGRSAHLDVGGQRGKAIRLAIENQLGLIVTDIKPFGLAGSGGSTPLRLTTQGDPEGYLFAKLYARTHLRADRWYKLGRELLYGRLEDEKPFNGVRRLVQQEDYALRVMRDAGLPSPEPYGFVELTPEREYLLITEFFEHATELGEAQIDDDVIDDGLRIVRRLWDAGLAHRDIKPANLLVRDHRMFLIDVAFAEVRPTPWRQAVDLANMMLSLALRTTPERVYQRALRLFSVEEITEAFAAARGLALPSQLRRALRAAGRDVHGEFMRLLPESPKTLRVQRWSARRLGLWAIIVGGLFLIAFNSRNLLKDPEINPSLNITSLSCQHFEPLWLEAQSVPSAAAVPCVRSMPVGWTFGHVKVSSGRSTISLNHDRAGAAALTVRLTATCDTEGAQPAPGQSTVGRRFQRGPGTWYDVFTGGCVTTELRSKSHLVDVNADLPADVSQAVSLMSRDTLQDVLHHRSDGGLHLDRVTRR
jgi:tRNA A-37 threonylcarbamoyl transferase component Bud32